MLLLSNDQIGIPRELADEQGKVCWGGGATQVGEKLKKNMI
ncbi:hypothetical protein [Rodentibacter trehalosifermentans]|nr:hypothetical protein [Rodentibacter trehalosifermentans]